MSKLQLSTPVQFAPLKKYTKHTMRYVEDELHHAMLTYMDETPTEEWRHTDYSYSQEELCDMIATYGIKPKYAYAELPSVNDDELYAYAREYVNKCKRRRSV